MYLANDASPRHLSFSCLQLPGKELWYGILAAMNHGPPIILAALLLIAPVFPSIDAIIAKDTDAPDIPFHTPVHETGFVIPHTIDHALTIGPDQGTIILQDTVTISLSGSLTILPGTTIFAHEYAAIRVQGRLDAVGTRAEPVQFLSNERNEQNKHWSGILYEQGSGGSIQQAIFHHASPSVSCQAGADVFLGENTYQFGNKNVHGPCTGQMTTGSVQ